MNRNLLLSGRFFLLLFTLPSGSFSLDVTADQRVKATAPGNLKPLALLMQKLRNS